MSDLWMKPMAAARRRRQKPRKVRTVKCSRCHGKGWVFLPSRGKPLSVECCRCHGTGKVKVYPKPQWEKG